MKPLKIKRYVVEALILLAVLVAGLGILGHFMGGKNLMNTIMATAHDLLLNTVFFLMGITVLAGALGKLLSEFGVVQLLEKLLRPLMKPLYRLPGVSAIGAVMTFLSDNPAIIALSKDRKFASYFKKYQLVSLTNFGTSFGMGLIVILMMMSYGKLSAALVGLFGAICGSIISTRLMQRFTLKSFPEMDSPVIEGAAADGSEDADVDLEASGAAGADGSASGKPSRRESVFMRFLNAILDGGKSGVDLGLQIIPGVLIITTFVLLITFDAGAAGEYNGSAAQGVPILPWLAGKIHWVFEWLFGFKDMRLLAFPMTALGAVGAALGLLPSFSAAGILDGNAIAVCTAIGMCWSGYLSTHTAMLDSLGYRKLIGKAIGAHTIAGFCAGVIAHFVWLLVSLL